MKAAELFTFSDDLPFGDFFDLEMKPWVWVQQIKKALASFDFDAVEDGSYPPGLHVDKNVYIHPTVKLPPYGVIEGPAYIGPETELRPGVYIRGNVIAGRGCVMGNSSEFKNSLLLDGVQTPHFNYVGDSILGKKSHLGAGVICANLRLDQQGVVVNLPEGKRVHTEMRKLGVLLGDEAEAGCNSVFQPGSIIGRRSVIVSMPFSGYLEPETIAFVRSNISRIKRRN